MLALYPVAGRQTRRHPDTLPARGWPESCVTCSQAHLQLFPPSHLHTLPKVLKGSSGEGASWEGGGSLMGGAGSDEVGLPGGEELSLIPRNRLREAPERGPMGEKAGGLWRCWRWGLPVSWGAAGRCEGSDGGGLCGHLKTSLAVQTCSRDA